MFSSDVLKRKFFLPSGFCGHAMKCHARQMQNSPIYDFTRKYNHYYTFSIVWKVHYQQSYRARYLNQMLNATSFISV